MSNSVRSPPTAEGGITIEGGAGFRGGGATGRQHHRENFVPGGTMSITMPPNALSLDGASFAGAKEERHRKAP